MDEKTKETVNEIADALENVMNQQQTLCSLIRVFSYSMENLTGYAGLNCESNHERAAASMASNISSAFEILEFLQDSIQEQTERAQNKINELV